MVNRVWAQLFGQGLVNPIDNLTDENDATHPELFDELTRSFTANGFEPEGAVARGSATAGPTSGPAARPATVAAPRRSMPG